MLRDRSFDELRDRSETPRTFVRPAGTRRSSRAQIWLQRALCWLRPPLWRYAHSGGSVEIRARGGRSGGHVRPWACRAPVGIPEHESGSSEHSAGSGRRYGDMHIAAARWRFVHGAGSLGGHVRPQACRALVEVPEHESGSCVHSAGSGGRCGDMHAAAAQRRFVHGERGAVRGVRGALRGDGARPQGDGGAVRGWRPERRRRATAGGGPPTQSQAQPSTPSTGLTGGRPRPGR